MVAMVVLVSVAVVVGVYLVIMLVGGPFRA